MKPPPRKTEEEMTMKELREHKKLKEAEAEADRIEEEEREKAIVGTTDVQNCLITEAERDIRIVKSKIDDMKERYYAYDSEYGYVNKLENLYAELATAEHKLQMIRLYPFNAPIITIGIKKCITKPQVSMRICLTYLNQRIGHTIIINLKKFIII